MTRARLRAIMVVCLLVAGCGGSASRTGRGPTPTTALPTTPSTSSTSAHPPAQPRKRRAAPAGHRPKPPHRATPAAGPGASGPAQPPSSATPKPTAPAAPASVTVTLALHGGGNLTLGDCGAQHHYRLYPVGSTVKFSGSVSPVPSGKWKVKLKIKVCRGSDFVELTKLDASQNRQTGAFSGSFPAPASGAYKARAELYLGTNDIARTGERHFATR